MSGLSENSIILDETGEDQEVVAAVTDKAIVVTGLSINRTAGAVFPHFESATTPISGPFFMTSGINVTLPHNRHGWFRTVPGEALNLDASGAGGTWEGLLTYRLE